MLRLSVIIPVVRTLARLEDTLVSVLEHKPDDCDVIVVLDEAYSDPYGLAGEVTFLAAGPGTTLAQAINLGLRVSEAPLVHVLPAGNCVHRGWADAAMTHFRDSRVAAVVPVALHAEDPERILAAGMGYDRAGQLVFLQRGITLKETQLCHRTQVLPHFSGAIFRSAGLQAVHGADESLSDRWVLADLTLRLLQMGSLTVLEPHCWVLSDPDVEPSAVGFAAARDAETFFWRWCDRRGITFVRHLALLTREIWAAVPHRQVWPSMAGRLAGLTRRVDDPRQHVGDLPRKANGHAVSQELGIPIARAG
ncbi:MAG: glycosyltransferase family 2 protein [Thermogutta sp.]